MDSFLPEIYWTNLLIIPGLLIGYTVHELGHAFTAYYLGDFSQVERGKFTLNPFRHVSWFGSIAFLLFGIGWPNPMEMNAQKFRERPLAVGAIAAAGPIASITFCLAAVLITLLFAALLVYSSGATTETIFQLLFPPTTDLPQALDMQALAMAFTGKLAVASFWLALTSILPLPTLDGFVIIVSLFAYFQTRKSGPQPLQQATPASPAAPAAPPPPAPDEKRFIPVNQYKRRNNISDLHFKLGVEYHEANKYDDAIARYRQALANDKQFGPAYVNLGLAYLAKGKRREAIHAFRGAIQFADDQKSQQAAWYQLHQLSDITPIDHNAQENIAEMGAAPWTDTKPRPNWLSLGVGTGLILIGGIVFYSYLFNGLVQILQV